MRNRSAVNLMKIYSILLTLSVCVVRSAPVKREFEMSILPSQTQTIEETPAPFTVTTSHPLGASFDTPKVRILQLN